MARSVRHVRLLDVSLDLELALLDVQGKAIVWTDLEMLGGWPLSCFDKGTGNTWFKTPWNADRGVHTDAQKASSGDLRNLGTKERSA